MIWVVLCLIFVVFLIWAFVPRKPGPTDPETYALSQRNEHNINQSSVQSYIQTKHIQYNIPAVQAKAQMASALAELHKAEGTAKAAKAENDLAMARQGLAYELELLQHGLAQETVKANTAITEQAGENGLTLIADQELKVEGGKSKIKTDEQGRLDALEVEKFKQMKSEELKNTLEEMRERVRLAIIADRLVDHQLLELVLEQAERLHAKMTGIRENPSLTEVSRTRLLNDYEEVLLTLKENRRGIEDRLRSVQEDNGQGLRQVHETANLRGDYKKELASGEE
jgi:hypothetical protein